MKQNTYFENRLCQNCGAPIADQVHALRKFCLRKISDDRTIDCCKDRYNTAKRKRENKPYKEKNDLYKEIDKRLDALIKYRHCNVFFIYHLYAFGIKLDDSLRKEINYMGFFTYYFIKYHIKFFSPNICMVFKNDYETNY